MSAWVETMSGWTTSLELELDKTNHVQSGLHSLNPPTTSKTGQFTDPVQFSYHLGLLTWYHTSLVNVIFFFSFFDLFFFIFFFYIFYTEIFKFWFWDDEMHKIYRKGIFEDLVQSQCYFTWLPFTLCSNIRWTIYTPIWGSVYHL